MVGVREQNNSQREIGVSFMCVSLNMIQGRVVRSTLPQWLGILTAGPNNPGSGDAEAVELEVKVPGEDR